MMKKMSPALRESLISTAFSAVILILAIACHGGGYLHPESSEFLLNYNADRPLLNIIFDPQKNDWTLYQCRELSYFIDWIDAQIIFALMKIKCVWFISFSTIIFSLFTIFFQQYAGRQLFPRLPGMFFTFHAAALALLPALTGNIFFRSSKAITTAGLTVLIFGTALRYLKRNNFFSSLKVCAVAAAVTVLADRQGVFYVTGFTGVIAVMQIFRPRYILKKVLRICSAVIVAAAAANLFIVPWIIRFLNNYTPDFSYQGDFSARNSLFFHGVDFFIANLGNAFCGLSNVQCAEKIGLSLLCAISYLLFRFRHRHLPFRVFPGVAAGIAICCEIMTLRHPPLRDIVIFSGCFLPSMAIVTFFYFAALAGLPGKLSGYGIIIPLLAICLRLYPYIYPEKLSGDIKNMSVFQNASVQLKHAVQNPQSAISRQKPLPYNMELLLKKLENDEVRKRSSLPPSRESNQHKEQKK